VVQKLLRKARKGTRVIFVPGNHDEFARRYLGHNFGGIDVVEEHIHTTADGRQLWVTHGDLFDGVIQCAKWLAYVGDWAYELTLRINRHFNSLRARMGLPYWSLSKYLKLKVKRAVSYVGDFEAAVAREARERGVHGVVCGHIHHAEMRDIDGILYCNDGDWVESLTALVEHADGRRSIWRSGAHGPRWWRRRRWPDAATLGCRRYSEAGCALRRSTVAVNLSAARRSHRHDRTRTATFRPSPPCRQPTAAHRARGLDACRHGRAAARRLRRRWRRQRSGALGTRPHRLALGRPGSALRRRRRHQRIHRPRLPAGARHS
jgi:UDP-2,3-diacylglucosamine pyrophosphatase LpxH